MQDKIQQLIKILLYHKYISAMKIQENKEIIQVQNGFVTQIAEYSPKQNYLVVALSSGEISFIQIDPLVHLNSVKVFNQYATAVLKLDDKILIGSKNGCLAVLDSANEIISKIKLHNDCISSILKSEEYFITTSYDGNIKFLDKKSFQVAKNFNIGQPIFKALEFNNCIYTTGNKSYMITCYSNEVKELKRFDYFASYKRKLYGCSDERGLTCVTSNSNSYIPCNLILPMKDKMIIISDQCIGQIFHTDHMQWKCYRKKQIKSGTYFVGGCVINQNKIILADHQGQILKIMFEQEEQKETK